MVDVTRVHIDAALSNLSVKYTNHNLIGEEVAKVLMVAKESDKYYTYGKQSFKRIPTHRIDGAEANEIHQKYTNEPYSCQEHALRDIVTDKIRQNADQPLNPELDATELTTDLILLELENEVQTAMRTSANYTNSNTTTLSSTTQWSDYVNSVPLTNIKDAKASVRKLIGKEANCIILSGDVAETLSLHPDIKELRKYTDSNLLTDAGLPPKILGLKVIEGKATEDVAYSGLTASMSYLWGKDAIVCYIPEGGIQQKMIAPWITIRVKGYRNTRKWREEKRKGDMVEVCDDFVVKEVADEAAYLIVDAIA